MTSNVRTIVVGGLPDDVPDLLTARLPGVRVRTAADAEDILAVLRAGDADLLVLNHTLAGPSGIDALRRVRSVPAYRTLPVLYLLDRHLDSTLGRQLLQQLGVDQVLVYPLDQEEVVTAAATLLGISSPEPEPGLSPAPGPAAPGVPEPPGHPAYADDQSEYVLIVDADAKHGRQLVAEAAARGIHAMLARTPEEARQAWERRTPGALLLDLGIRNGNGEEGLALLEELSRLTTPIPVLVMTARDTFLDRVQVAAFGGRGFLHRTLPPNEVLETVARVLQQARISESRVLVVDDRVETLEEVRRALEPAGIRVTTLEDPLRFWDTLEQMAPDLLVLDLELTRWSGIELCRVVRNDPRWSTLPVVLLTPRVDPETIRGIFAAGADDYVVRPLVGVELVTKLVNRLERTSLYRGMAEIDPMTGVANRRKSVDALRQFLRLAERHRQPFCLALLDADGFKQINDRYGHDVGDAVLQQLAKRLSRTFRLEDIVARWGGEEFLIGMYGTTRADGVQRLREVLEGVRHEAIATTGGEEIRITFSAGVAQYPEDGMAVESLYRAADQALYRAKRAGRDRIIPAGGDDEGTEAPGVRCVDVVVVDDDEVLGGRLVQMLESQGYRTQWLRDGESAAAMMGGPDPVLRAPVALIDVDISGLDGLGVLRRLARDRVLRRTRVIMLTRRTGDPSTSRAREIGAFDHVAKSVALPALLQRVRRALEVL